MDYDTYIIGYTYRFPRLRSGKAKVANAISSYISWAMGIDVARTTK
jgi:hypothetical protein